MVVRLAGIVLYKAFFVGDMWARGSFSMVLEEGVYDVFVSSIPFAFLGICDHLVLMLLA